MAFERNPAREDLIAHHPETIHIHRGRVHKSQVRRRSIPQCLQYFRSPPKSGAHDVVRALVVPNFDIKLVEEHITMVEEEFFTIAGFTAKPSPCRSEIVESSQWNPWFPSIYRRNKDV
jgi:hypothetical protein